MTNGCKFTIDGGDPDQDCGRIIRETIDECDQISTRFKQGGRGKERRKLIRSLCTEGISWQGRNERKGLAELLANERATSPLLKYLKSTESGGREGGKERELDGETIRPARRCLGRS